MFTGREYDIETGLYYYRARYYSPGIGRFLQRDPLSWGPDDRRILNLTSFNKYNLLYITAKSVLSLHRNTDIAKDLIFFIIITKETNPFQNIPSHYLSIVSGINEISTNQLLHMSLLSVGQRDPWFLHNYLYCLNNPLNIIDPYGYFSLGEIVDVMIGSGLIGIGIVFENPWLISGGVAWIIISPISRICDEAIQRAAKRVKKMYEERLRRILSGEPY
jgi:RHS repeat-associated protein